MKAAANPGTDSCSLGDRPTTVTARPEEVVTRFASAVANRDYEGVRGLLGDDVAVRALLPRGLQEWCGADATIEHFQYWYDRMLAAWGRIVAPARVEDRFVTGWHHEGSFEDGSGRHVIEQRVVVRVGDDRITHIDLLCTGFRPATTTAAVATRPGDAGDLR